MFVVGFTDSLLQPASYLVFTAGSRWKSPPVSFSSIQYRFSLHVFPWGFVRHFYNGSRLILHSSYIFLICRKNNLMNEKFFAWTIANWWNECFRKWRDDPCFQTALTNKQGLSVGVPLGIWSFRFPNILFEIHILLLAPSTKSIVLTTNYLSFSEWFYYFTLWLLYAVFLWFFPKY